MTSNKNEIAVLNDLLKKAADKGDNETVQAILGTLQYLQEDDND